MFDVARLAGLSCQDRSTTRRSLPLIFMTLILGVLYAPAIFAQIEDLEDQISRQGIGCGADFLGQTWTCRAGEIAISQVSGVIIQGDPANCVLGEPLIVQQAIVEYNINTSSRNDLTMYIGDQEGTDPRSFDGTRIAPPTRQAIPPWCRAESDGVPPCWLPMTCPTRWRDCASC